MNTTDSPICTEIPADDDALIIAITTLAGHINAAQHRFLKLLAALIERESWGDGGGMKSPAHWLNYYCGIDLGAAREKVRVAKSLVGLPQIDAAFASGAISYSKVRAMTRSVSPPMRRALTIRDHGCRFPGCTETRFVDAHHIQHWCDGGDTSLDNLVLLCRRHRGNIEFRRPDQPAKPEVLFPQFSEQVTDAEDLAIERQHQHMGMQIDELTAVSHWQGERMDYSMAVAGMQSVAGEFARPCAQVAC